MVVSVTDTPIMERKVFLGEKAFEIFKSHFGVLYGNSFTLNGIEFILHSMLPANSMLTTDPQLVIIFRQFEVRMKANKLVSVFEELIAEIKAKGVL